MAKDLPTGSLPAHASSADTPLPVTLPGEVDTTAPMPSVPGYEIQGVLGRGGMSVVYLARHLGLDRLVALKVVLFAEHASPELRRRFLHEARTVARLSHLNVVQVHDVAEHNGLPYLTLEYCAGGTLADRLAKGPMEVREAAEVVRTLALAVHAAHEKGIVHRDLKPANVLFTADGALRVADFGLAKCADAGQNTQSGAPIGTPSYMAPEQARGKLKEISPQTDVWALGVILYECLTGKPPFHGEDTLDTLMRVIDRAPERLRQMRKDVPPDLEAICLRCLEKAAANRPASAKVLADDLGNHLAGSPPNRQQWVRTSSRRSVAAALIALILGSAAIGTWRWQREWTAPDQNASLTPDETSFIEPKPEPDEIVAIVEEGGFIEEVDRQRKLLQPVHQPVPLTAEQIRERIKPREKPNLYGMIAGINDYSTVGRPLSNLRYAAPDSKAVHAAFAVQKGQFYRAVQLELLVDKQVTRAAILDWLASLVGRVRPEDRLVLYLSGSGVANENDSFYFVCANTNLAQRQTMLTGNDIVTALRKLPCFSIVFIDACHAGAILREPGLDPKRHLVFAACGLNEQANEPSEKATVLRPSLKDVTNSFFSFLLLEALRTHTADLDHDGVLDTRELFIHVRNGMPRLLRRFEERDDSQVPVLFPPSKDHPALGIITMKHDELLIAP